MKTIKLTKCHCENHVFQVTFLEEQHLSQCLLPPAGCKANFTGKSNVVAPCRNFCKLYIQHATIQQGQLNPQIYIENTKM